MNHSLPDLVFPAIAGRSVVGRFDGGELSSDAGLLLVAEADRVLGLTSALSEALPDRRQQSKVQHDLLSMLRERIYAIALGYEDANDLDTLREDPALKLACRRRPSQTGVLASQPTISRLENAVAAKALLKMGYVIAERAVAQLPEGTKEVILDIDATSDPCHGQQELSLFDGHCGTWGYLPLLMHITDETGRQQLLGTLLRSACGRSTKGVMGMVRRAVRVVRARFPHVRIHLRGDCAFGYGKLMNWCDKHGVEYVAGFQSTVPLMEQALSVQMQAAIRHSIYKREANGCREYGEVLYRGRTWDRERRIIIKAEASAKTVDTRFVVTSWSQERADMAEVYRFYTERGDRENRIKEMKLDLASGRTSCHRFVANQFRLLLHTAACVLMGVLQQACEGTRWSKAQVGTLRARLLKVAVRVVESCRKIWLHLPTSFPEQTVWHHMLQSLQKLAPDKLNWGSA